MMIRGPRVIPPAHSVRWDTGAPSRRVRHARTHMVTWEKHQGTFGMRQQARARRRTLTGFGFSLAWCQIAPGFHARICPVVQVICMQSGNALSPRAFVPRRSFVSSTQNVRVALLC